MYIKRVSISKKMFGDSKQWPPRMVFVKNRLISPKPGRVGSAFLPTRNITMMQTVGKTALPTLRLIACYTEFIR